MFKILLFLIVQAILSVVILAPGYSETLQGFASNSYGRIGVRISDHGRIYHVYKQSPAAVAGLNEGDTILSADGIKGIKYIDGIAGTTVYLVVKRKGNILKFQIVRTIRSLVHD